ncbi:restriction endonuclease subunit S [Candidatus Giovannonibacteria bacterium]|nr:restriction endonuclease subunit S [Candidatus Giovannonibacteria bacterium]
MAVFSVIQKSQLEGAHRLDAEYYQREYFIDFTKGNWVPIGEVLELCQYGLSQAMNDEKKGYPIFKMDNIDYGFLFNDDIRFADIPKSIFNQFAIKKDDVFFNRVNSEEFVGRTGIYKLDSLKSVFASYLIRLRVKSGGEILADYLNIFLNSSYGLRQIRKYTRRAVNQANVNAEELKLMRISVLPITTQEKIRDLSNWSWHEFEKSKFIYSQAETLLLEELGLKDFENEEKLWSVVNFSEIKSANRMDAEYFQPKYEQMLNQIRKKSDVKKLSEIASVKRGSLINPRFYDDENGTPYIRGGDFSSGRLERSKLVYIKNFQPKNETRIKTGDIIFASIGSVGTLTNISDEFNDAFISNNTAMFSIKDRNFLISEYLTLVLQSIVGKLQFEKEMSQTAQPKISDTQVKSFYIPILPKPVQQKIADLVRQSHEARKKAKELLVEAKHKVEELIEKGNK